MCQNKRKMKGYFNIIPGKDTCCILLYGTIGEGGDVKASVIVQELLEAEQTYKHIDVRINSIGGDVYTGIAIFNALRNSQADITIYIDCMAASIASVIAGCGKRVKMSRYARLVIHRVQGGDFGDVDVLRRSIANMEQLEATLCDIYAERTGMSAAEIRATYMDGEDHFLSADEALQLGFVDEIYDAEPMPDIGSSDPEKISAAYTARYINQLNKNTNQMFEKLKTLPRFAACVDEAAALRCINELEGSAAELEALRKENAELKAKVEKYKQAEVDAEEAADEQYLDNAIKEERIKCEQKESYKAMLSVDRKNTKAIIDSFKPKKRIIDQLGGNGGEKESAWDKRMKEIEDSNRK